MARAVIRYGGRSDEGSKDVRSQIRATLAAAAFEKTGNASWSVENVPLAQICGALERVAAVIGDSASASFEQLWVMVDQADESPAQD